MANKVKLKAPPGTDEANVGTERFRVDNDGTIEVPAEAAASLEGVGGFERVPEETPESETAPADEAAADAEMEGENAGDPASADAKRIAAGLVRVMHEDEGAGCAYRGVSYARHEDGSFHVPANAVAELASHGFVALGDE